MGEKKTGGKKEGHVQQEDSPDPAVEKEEPREKKAKKEKSTKYEKEPVEKKTALGDTATIKRLMDDAVVNVLIGQPIDGSAGEGHVEDTGMSNFKLVVGFSAVGSSLLSHVYPAQFPKNWWVLLACCSFYFAMSGVLQLLLSFVELESILLVRGKEADSTSGTKKRSPALNFSSHFPRFQEFYTLGVVPVPGGSLALASAPRFRPELEGGNPAPGCMQRSWSVAGFFDEEGTFAEEAFEKEVQSFMRDYQAKAGAGAESKKTQ